MDFPIEYCQDIYITWQKSHKLQLYKELNKIINQLYISNTRTKFFYDMLLLVILLIFMI